MKHYIVENKIEKTIFMDFMEDPLDKKPLYVYGFSGGTNKPYIFNNKNTAESVAIAMGDGYTVEIYKGEI